MPAVIRGAAKGGGRGRGAKRPATYTPAKLGRGAAVGLDARAAVWAVAGLLGAGAVLAAAIGGLARAGHGDLHLGLGLPGRLADGLTAALGFKVTKLTVKGATPVATPAIAAATGLHPGDPILGVNLDRLREWVEGVGWVKTAEVRRILPDTIVVAVKPRTLLAVWQHGELANVVDVDGQIVPEAEVGGFTDLPLIVGEGANEAASAILPLVQARPRLMARIDALQRVDARRWRLKLKDGGIIDLPAKGEDAALIQFDQLDARSHLLDLGFDRVDLRDPAMTEVRMKGAPPVAAAVEAKSASTSTL